MSPFYAKATLGHISLDCGLAERYVPFFYAEDVWNTSLLVIGCTEKYVPFDAKAVWAKRSNLLLKTEISSLLTVYKFGIHTPICGLSIKICLHLTMAICNTDISSKG